MANERRTNLALAQEFHAEPAPPERKRTHLLAALALLSGSLLFTAAAAEIALRVLGIGYGNAPFSSDPVLHHVHPQNYLFTVHDPLSNEFGGHRVRYDENSLRIAVNGSSTVQPSTAKYRVAFMGDSFVEALPVAFEDSFVGILSANASPETEIRNYGVSSYSPVLQLLQWQQQVSSFKPTHVFLMLYSNDIADDEKYLAQAVVSKSGDITAVPGPGDSWWKQIVRKSYLARFMRKVQLQLTWGLKNWGKENHEVTGYSIEENPEISELTAKHVLQLATEVQSSGAVFQLTVVPSKARLQDSLRNVAKSNGPEFSEKWRSWAETHNIPFIDLTAAFQHAAAESDLFFERDIHFNEFGNTVAASVLQNYLPSDGAGS